METIITQKHTFAIAIIVLLVAYSATGLNATEYAKIIDSETTGTANNGNDQIERTLLMLKPDAAQRGLIGKIIERFESKGLKLVGLKFVQASKELMEQHYSNHANLPFFPYLIKFMISSPVVPMVWEGLNAVQVTRSIIGDADIPAPGTIRGDFSVNRGYTVIHGSHSLEAAKNEINLWFQSNELVSWKLPHIDPCIDTDSEE